MRIPIKEARDFAKRHGLTHVIIFCHSEDADHIVTYGKSVEQAGQAADFGNKLKSAQGWPDSLLAQPSRVRRIVEAAEAALSAGQQCSSVCYNVAQIGATADQESAMRTAYNLWDEAAKKLRECINAAKPKGAA